MCHCVFDNNMLMILIRMQEVYSVSIVPSVVKVPERLEFKSTWILKLLIGFWGRMWFKIRHKEVEISTLLGKQ